LTGLRDRNEVGDTAGEVGGGGGWRRKGGLRFGGNK